MAAAAEVFKGLDAAIKANQDKAKKINGIFQWSIDGKDYVIDLKELKAGPGKHAKPDVTLTVAEKDFLDLMSGKGNGQSMFMSGKIKFKGNMAMLMKLGDLAKMQQ